jgi:hypothetical protein
MIMNSRANVYDAHSILFSAVLGFWKLTVSLCRACPAIRGTLLLL